MIFLSPEQPSQGAARPSPFTVEGAATQSRKTCHPVTELVGSVGLDALAVGELPELTKAFSLETAGTPGALGPLHGCRCEDRSGRASAGRLG